MAALRPPWLACLGGTLIFVLLVSAFLGRSPEPFWTPFSSIWQDDSVYRLVFHERLPHLIMALMLGAALSTGGYVLQMLSRNPLADPGLLGVPQGAAFGAALSILLSQTTPSLLGMRISAILFAAAAFTLSCLMARRIRIGEWILRLILAGIIVSAFFTAGIGLLHYSANPAKPLPGIAFWILGGLGIIGWKEVFYSAVFLLPALILLYAFRWRLNVLSLEQESAIAVGSLDRERILFAALAVIAVAAVTASTGIICWVGLVLPLLARRFFGADASRSLLPAMLGGALFVLICDDLARVVLVLPVEIPLGVLTSLLGTITFWISITNWKMRSWK